MLKIFCKTSFLIIILFIFCGCAQEKSQKVNSAYFWKTIWKLDSAEIAFIKKYNISRIYVRYFDIVEKNGKIVPNASLIPSQDVVNINCEVVPTVFIDVNCLKNNILEYTNKIVDRIFTMSETLGIKNITQIQIDCDYTANSLNKYYNFLSKLKSILEEKNIKLSVTIRLHQLTMPAPKVDYGVLMLYNTGDFRDRNCKNPILDYVDVEPYIKNIKNYNLPLSSAYPNFSWNLLFDGDKFKHILYGEDLSDSIVYKKISENLYKVVSSKEIPLSLQHNTDVIMLNVGNDVEVKKSLSKQILKVKQEINKIRPNVSDEIIIYDLNSKNINNLSELDYKEVFE